VEDFSQKIAEGLVYFNLEQSDFRPLDVNEVWWIERPQSEDPDDALMDAFRTLANNSHSLDRHATYAKIEAQISPAGYYGHRGGYQRTIQVLQVLEIRKALPQEIARRKEVEREQ